MPLWGCNVEIMYYSRRCLECVKRSQPTKGPQMKVAMDYFNLDSKQYFSVATI